MFQKLIHSINPFSQTTSECDAGKEIHGEPADDSERARQFSSVLDRFQARLAAAKEKEEAKEKAITNVASGSAQTEGNSPSLRTNKKSQKLKGKKLPAAPKCKIAGVVASKTEPIVGVGRGRGKVRVDGQRPGKKTETFSASQNTRSASSSSSNEARLRKF